MSDAHMRPGNHYTGEYDPDMHDDLRAPDDDVVHEVSTLEWLLADVAGLRVPRALCGVVLVADPDRPDPAQLGAPRCPRCATKGGRL